MNRESLIWTIVVVVAGALLLGRAFLTEHGMGKAYVEERPVDRVKVVPPDAVADPETGEVERVWMDAEEAASAGIELPDEGSEDRIQWTDYAASQYRLYVEAEQQDPNQTQYQFSIARSIGLWIAAALTLFVMSFLIKDNPLYKIAESIFVGVSAAYWMVISFWNTLVPNLFAHLVPDLVKATVMPGLGDDAGFQPLYLIPLVLAIMLLWRLSPVGSWISRWPMAFFIGVFLRLAPDPLPRCRLPEPDPQQHRAAGRAGRGAARSCSGTPSPTWCSSSACWRVSSTSSSRSSTRASSARRRSSASGT
jgi:hypothetical protein